MRLSRAEAVLLAQASQQSVHLALLVLLHIRRHKRDRVPRFFIPRERLSLETYNDVDALADFRYGYHVASI